LDCKNESNEKGGSMTIIDAVRGAVNGFVKGMQIPVRSAGDLSQPLAVINSVNQQSKNPLTVVDTLKLPNQGNVPGSWSRQWMGPGKPFTPIANYMEDEKEQEPRSFQYVTSVNSTISPRAAYGLTAFADLKMYYNTVPEVALCVNLPIEELKSYIPSLVDENDNSVDIPELNWMITKPDGFNPFPVWLSRWGFNILVYDAPALYKIRSANPESLTIKKIDMGNGYARMVKSTELVSGTGELKWWCEVCGGENLFEYHKSDDDEVLCEHCGSIAHEELQKIIEHDNELQKNDNPIVGLRIIDGSTIFAVIDERGEQPAPPAPAFTQVIWGTPRMYLNTHQLWYRPRFLRPDAPYGTSFIERALPAVRLLQSIWEFERAKYETGNLPDMGMECPPEWTDVDKILEYEDLFNGRMNGSAEERAGKIRFFPSGMKTIVTKNIEFNKDAYETAANTVSIQAGIPKSERGEAPEGMLGGKGYAEAMNSSFYRMCIAPLQGFIEGMFNEIIEENGYTDVKFKLKFPTDSMDPETEENKFATRFAGGGITRDEYREGIRMRPMGGEKGEFIITPGKGGEDADAAGPAVPGKKAGLGTMVKPVGVLKDPIDVLKDPVKVHKFDMAEEAGTKLFNEEELRQAGRAAAKQLGDSVGVDWSTVDLEEFIKGLLEEQEHAETVNGDQHTIALIVLDHLHEDPNYYDKLNVAMAKVFGNLWKYTGVDLEDDQYFGTSISKPLDAEMPHQGANGSYIVSIGGVGQESAPAVWKPVVGEKESLKKWIGGDLYRRSEAVYLVDRELAPDVNHYLVPVTWIDKMDGIDGSVQHYVRGRQKREQWNTYGKEWIEQAAVLDYITGQVDRVNKNWLTHPTDNHRPILIDNDLSFPSTDTNIRSTWVKSMEGKELSTRILDSVFLLVGNHDLWEDIGNCLEDQTAINKAMQRAESILELRMIPGTKKLDKLEKIKEAETGVMVSIDIPVQNTAEMDESKIDWPSGSEALDAKDQHVTLAFLGDIPDLDYGEDSVVKVVQELMKSIQFNNLEGSLNGVGRFLETHRKGMNCIYVNFDCPNLNDIRSKLVDKLNRNGCHVEDNHGFTPHMTWAYIPEDAPTPDTSSFKVQKVKIDGLSVHWGEKVTFIPFQS
jgi:2'-5' RNA ligase